MNILQVTEHGGERGTRETEPTKEIQQSSNTSLVVIQESSDSDGKKRKQEQTKQAQGGDSGGDIQGEQPMDRRKTS